MSECGELSPDGRMVCQLKRGHDGAHEDWRAVAGSRLDTDRLPPWACCGGRGPHAEGCRYAGQPVAEEVHADGALLPIALIPADLPTYYVDPETQQPTRIVELEPGDLLENTDPNVAVRLPDGQLLGPVDAVRMDMLQEPDPQQLELPAEVLQAALGTDRVQVAAACGATHPHAGELGIVATCQRRAGHPGAHELANGRSWLPHNGESGSP